MRTSTEPMIGSAEAMAVRVFWLGLALLFVGSFLPWVRAMDVSVAGSVGLGRRAAVGSVLTGIVFALMLVAGRRPPSQAMVMWHIVVLACLCNTVVAYLIVVGRLITNDHPAELAGLEFDPQPGIGIAVGLVGSSVAFVALFRLMWHLRRRLLGTR